MTLTIFFAQIIKNFSQALLPAFSFQNHVSLSTFLFSGAASYPKHIFNFPVPDMK